MGSSNAECRSAVDAADEQAVPSIERLTASDLMLIWPEEEGWPQDIGALAILDGRSLIDADGRFRIEAAREHIERRAHLLPRFHQVLYWPRFGLGWPLWVDAPSFDIAEHVGVFPVAAPGDDTQLLRACETLRRRPLDRTRPLWQMWFLPGLPGGRVGFFMKLHHAIADGVAGVAALGAFLDLAPVSPEPRPGPWSRTPTPSTRELFEDNVRRRIAGLDRVLSAIVTPVTTMRRMQRSWPAAREIFAEGRAPRTTVNRRIGSDRRLAIIRTNLDDLKAIAHAHDAKINDVLLTAVAGGYAELLRSRGERVDTLVLRAFVPVSLHQEQRGSSEGQRRRRDGRSPPHRRARPRPAAANHRDGHPRAEEEDAAGGGQPLPKHLPPARVPAPDAASALHERIHRERPWPICASVLRRRSRARALPGRTHHRQCFDRRRCPLLRRASSTSPSSPTGTCARTCPSSSTASSTHSTRWAIQLSVAPSKARPRRPAHGEVR